MELNNFFYRVAEFEKKKLMQKTDSSDSHVLLYFFVLLDLLTVQISRFVMTSESQIYNENLEVKKKIIKRYNLCQLLDRRL